MFLFVENIIFDVRKIVTVEIDKDILSQINYYLCDGALLEETMETDEEAKNRLTELEDQSSFIKVRDDKLVNLIYIKSVKLDVINENTLVYTFYKGIDALVKEKFKTKEELDDKIEAVKTQLEEMNSDGGNSGEGGSVDLTPYLKKSEAEKTYAKKINIPDITGLASKEYVDGLVGNIEDLLGGI